VLLLGVVMAMVAYRRGTSGPLSYRSLITVGVLVALITAVFVGLMEYTYIAFINPDFYEQYGRMMTEGMRAKGASAAELAATRQEQESYAWMANPLMAGLFYFLETAVIGTILSLIGAPFLRRPEGASSAEEGNPLPDRPGMLQ
jgi:hypothetical protein